MIKYENIEEIIISLQDIFNKGKISVKKKGVKYLMNIEITEFSKTFKYEIELEKNELKDENMKILNKIKEIEDKYKELKEEINHIKNNNKIIYNEEDKNKVIRDNKNELNIKEVLKELLIKDKEIINILYNEFENKLNNDKKEEGKKIEESVNKILILNKNYSNKVDLNVYNDNINKIKEMIYNQINEINNIKNNLKENIENEINEYDKINNNNIKMKKLNQQINIVNNKIGDNYISLKIEINKDDIGKDIIILNQCWTYKLYENFELEDIEIEINGEHIPIKYKHYFENDWTKYDEKSKDFENSNKIYKELNNNYSFYWNFFDEGIYEIKIIFNKKLCSCAGLFYYCKNMIQIDLSNFNCSNILSCYGMFYECRNIKEINLGKIDFSLVTDFSYMFYCCKNLVNLDITKFNTKNSKSFSHMFHKCYSLKKIDVSKFNSSKCETINSMFNGCKSITEIDMINWDMSNLKYSDNENGNSIDYLFNNCSNLKKIKISGNIKKEEFNNSSNSYIFSGIPKNGDFVTNKNVICNIPLDGFLPQNWSRNKE